MATQEQVDKKIAVAQKRVDTITSKIEKARKAQEKANAAVTAGEASLKVANRVLELQKQWPVDGVVEADENENIDGQPAFI